MIQTANLKLIPCELQHFEAILNGPKQLEQMLGVTVLEGRTQGVRPAIFAILTRLRYRY